MWSELALIGIQAKGGSASAYAALTEDITAMDWGEKDIESRPMVSGGNAVRKIPMSQESITFKMIPISTGSTAEVTATGIMQLFHPNRDLTYPIVAANVLTRDLYKITILWATTLPANAETLPVDGIYAYRIEIFNAYMTACKPSYDDKGLSVEATFKWSPFQKDGTRNKIEESTDGTAQLAAVTSF